MHAVSLALYLGALLFLRSALRRTLGANLMVELCVLLFALHPLHVESVAWLAGQKDVLALLFIAAALHCHARAADHARITVPLLVLAACLSKSMSVAVLGLLAAQDFVLARRPNRVLYAGVLASIALALALHLHVGSVVGMLTRPPGGSRYTAFITMGPVWLRYLAHGLLSDWPERRVRRTRPDAVERARARRLCVRARLARSRLPARAPWRALALVRVGVVLRARSCRSVRCSLRCRIVWPTATPG